MRSPTLALEELLLHPRFAEIVEQIRPLIPVGLADQMDAAAKQVHTGMHALGEVVGMPTAATPTWLRLGALDALVDHVTRRADTCIHAPDPTRPRPVAAAAWKPGLIVCGACTHLLRLPRDSTADRTCDACGKECAGVEAGDPIYPAIVQLGPLVYTFGACIDCQHDIERAKP